MIDHETGAAIAGAKVIFYGGIDRVLLYEIEAMRRAGRKEIPALPKGVMGIADSSGLAKLRCTFGFTELTFESGEMRSEIYPEGEFRFECEGYSTLSLEASELFPQAPYLAKIAPANVTPKKTVNHTAEPVSPSLGGSS